MRGATDYQGVLYAERKIVYAHDCPSCGQEQVDGHDQIEWICGKCGESYRLSRLDKLEAIKEIIK